MKLPLKRLKEDCGTNYKSNLKILSINLYALIRKCLFQKHILSIRVYLIESVCNLFAVFQDFFEPSKIVNEKIENIDYMNWQDYVLHIFMNPRSHTKTSRFYTSVEWVQEILDEELNTANPPRIGTNREYRIHFVSVYDHSNNCDIEFAWKSKYGEKDDLLIRTTKMDRDAILKLIEELPCGRIMIESE